MTEWHLAQQEASDRLCKLHHFAVTKPHAGGEVEFVITIREYANPPDPAMQSLHTHFVQLTAQDFTDLAAGKTVRKGSCDDGHEHAFIMNCLGVESTEMPSVAAVLCDGHPGCGDTATTACPSLPAP